MVFRRSPWARMPEAEIFIAFFSSMRLLRYLRPAALTLPVAQRLAQQTDLLAVKVGHQVMVGLGLGHVHHLLFEIDRVAVGRRFIGAGRGPLPLIVAAAQAPQMARLGDAGGDAQLAPPDQLAETDLLEVPGAVIGGVRMGNVLGDHAMALAQPVHAPGDSLQQTDTIEIHAEILAASRPRNAGPAGL